MAATNFTPIQLYHSTTASAAPTAGNLENGELAINITDGKLFYKDNGGTVQVLATKGTGTIGGSNTQVQFNNAGALAGSANFTFNGTTATINTLNLTNALGATYGGTGLNSYTTGDIVYASASNTLSKLTIGTNGYILTSNGTTPTWTAGSSISVNTADNLSGGAAGSVPYQSGAGATTFLSIGAANRVLTSSGTAPQWVTSLTGLTGVSSSGLTNTSLTSGRVVYSTTGGAQTDSANLTFNGTTLTATGLASTGASTLDKLVKIGDSAFNLPSVLSATAPAKLYVSTATVTDASSAAGATNVTGTISALGSTTVAASNTGVTYTNLSTLYIAGAPTAGTNVTITNPYSLYIAAGAAYFGGAVNTGALTVSNLTDSALTSGRVTFAGTAGLLSDSANLTWDGTTLSAVGRLYNGSASTFGASTWGMSLGNGGVSANYFKASTTYWQDNAGVAIAQLSNGSFNVSGTGGRGVNLLGGGNGDVQIAGDGSTYAIGVSFHNNYASISTPMAGMFAYGSGGAYQYMSLGGSAYNNGALYIDSNKKVGIAKLPSAYLDVYNSTTMPSAASTGIGFTAAVTQATGTLTMATGAGAQRGNVMTIYGSQGSPTTTLPYGQDYESLGLTVAMDVAAGGGYGVTGVGSYVRSDGAAYAFRANTVLTTSTPGTAAYGFYAQSVSGANLNYGFYQNGSSTYNYFNGWVGVGVNNTPYGNVTNERMTIEGNTNNRSWLSVRNTNSGSGAYSGVVVNAYGNSWALEMGSSAANSNALNITKDIYGTPQVLAYMATSGVMTFYGDNSNRPVQIGGGYVRTKGETGGWQIGYYTQDSAGTIKGGFGAAGSNTTQSYNFIGPDATNSFARFTANGMGIAGTDPATSGVGITFPASQSASSDANTLDDYEEGTWTPVLGGTWTSNPTNMEGHYTKVGRLVTAFALFVGGTKNTTTSGYFTGLPFNTAIYGTGSVSDSSVDNRGLALAANTNVLWVTNLTFNATTYVVVSYMTNT